MQEARLLLKIQEAYRACCGRSMKVAANPTQGTTSARAHAADVVFLVNQQSRLLCPCEADRACGRRRLLLGRLLGADQEADRACGRRRLLLGRLLGADQ